MNETTLKILLSVGLAAVAVLGYLMLPRVGPPRPNLQVAQTRLALELSTSPTVQTPTATATRVPSPVPTIGAVVPINSATAARTTISATRTTGATSPRPSPSSSATRPATSTPNAAEKVPAKRTFNHTYTVKQVYDPVKDQTTVALEERPQDLTPVPNSLYVTYTIPGKTGRIPNAVDVSFFSSSKSWQFILTKDIVLRLDGTVSQGWPVTERGAAQGDSVTELLTAQVPILDFLAVVNAGRVEVQIGSYYFELTAEQLEALRDLASRMTP